jgi:Wzt C-terminal domain
VRDMCDRAAWLEHGNLVDMGDPAELVEAYTERMLGDRDRNADGSTRRGSGELQVESVEMFIGSSTTPVKRFRTGDDVRIRLHYAAGGRVPKPVFGVEIESLGGATITAPCTRDVGLLPEALSGHGFVDLQLQSVPLLPGTYDLHTSITDFNKQHIYDRLQVALRFDVMTGRPYETTGLVSLRPDWTIS